MGNEVIHLSKKKENFFGEINRLNSYWAGFLAADGFIHDDRNTISINLGEKDLDHLLKFAKIFGREEHVRRNRINNSYYLNLYGVSQLKSDLESNFKITYKKTFTLRPPEFEDLECKKAYICGYLDGDGNIAYESMGKGAKLLRMTILGTHAVLSWIKEEFDKQLETSSNKLEPHGKIFRYRLSGDKALSIIKFLKSDDIPLLERKWDINLDVPYYVEDKELEYKYNAAGIKLEDFEALMKKLPINKRKVVSSFDVYFTKDDNPDWFMRFRDSDIAPELTKKRKVKESDNWERVEVDLPLSPGKASEALIERFVSLDGYEKNFKIYKTCLIYWLDDANYVYYIVYDEFMNELDRYIEVEVNKDKAHDLGGAAFGVLKKYEQVLSPLGIAHSKRLKRSLFEIYRKSPISG
jgi:hypothetical protein